MSQSQPSYTTQPLAPALGATLHGLRLSALDEDGLAAIRRELRKHLVVAFPGQHLTVDELVAPRL
jgi:alpha-ketoglutarate-dependent taurine dioxygenase